MASDRLVQFTEADIKSFTKEQRNTNTKKETSHDLKQFKALFAKVLKKVCGFDAAMLFLSI